MSSLKSAFHFLMVPFYELTGLIHIQIRFVLKGLPSIHWLLLWGPSNNHYGCHEGVPSGRLPLVTDGRGGAAVLCRRPWNLGDLFKCATEPNGNNYLIYFYANRNIFRVLMYFVSNKWINKYWILFLKGFNCKIMLFAMLQKSFIKKHTQ